MISGSADFASAGRGNGNGNGNVGNFNGNGNTGDFNGNGNHGSFNGNNNSGSFNGNSNIGDWRGNGNTNRGNGNGVAPLQSAFLRSYPFPTAPFLFPCIPACEFRSSDPDRRWIGVRTACAGLNHWRMPGLELAGVLTIITPKKHFRS